jgi:hypothetical protein
MTQQEEIAPEFQNYMSTLSVVLEKMRIKGWDSEYKWTSEGFTIGTGKYYQPDELKIIKVFRFEGESDPADNSILYIIEGNDGLIGYSLDMYGAYSNHEGEEGYNEFIRKIQVADREDQLIIE